MSKKVYMIVTNDEYESPIKMDCIGVKEASEFIGVSENKIRKMMCGYRQWNTKYKVIAFGDYKPDYQKYAKEYSMTHDRTEYYKKYYQNHKEEIREKRSEYIKKYMKKYREERKYELMKIEENK